MADPQGPAGDTTAPDSAANPAGEPTTTPVADIDGGAGTTATATDAPADGGQAEDAFFDPQNLNPELLPAYKHMQASYTRAMQGISQQREKVKAYDAFMANPQASLQQVAQQYGLTLSQAAQAQAAADRDTDDGEWQPAGWEDVISRAKQEAKAELLRELEPTLQEVQNIRKSHIEATLDELAPEWREHEDAFVAALGEHPTLAKDPAKLARIALPDGVLEGRAMQRALKKLEARKESAQVSSGSATTNKPQPKPVTSFADAVRLAQEQTARG